MLQTAAIVPVVSTVSYARSETENSWTLLWFN